MPVTSLLAPIAAAARWSTESQLRSRRNAMVASTLLAQRRAEREDVADFLAALASEAAEAVGASSPSIRTTPA